MTPTEAQLLERLADGAVHPVGSLQLLLGDSSSLRVHLSNLRRKLKPQYDIVFREVDGEAAYMLMRCIGK